MLFTRNFSRVILARPHQEDHLSHEELLDMYDAEKENPNRAKDLLNDPMYQSVAQELDLQTHPDYTPGRYRIREEQGGFAIDLFQRNGKWLRILWRKNRSNALKAISEALKTEKSAG